jgi:hypothetical protein
MAFHLPIDFRLPFPPVVTLSQMNDEVFVQLPSSYAKIDSHKACKRYSRMDFAVESLL